MPKAFLGLIFTFFFHSCSSQEPISGQISQEQLEMVSLSGKEPVKDDSVGASPGMIPANCEALLNISQTWGYIPGQKWKVANAEKMMEVARFFSEFRLVPIDTSDSIRNWENGGAAPGSELQICDLFLSQTFLQAILEYKWGKAERLEATRHLHRFLLNQQALSMPLAHRALSAQVYVGSVRRGLMPGSHAKAGALGAWVEKEISAIAGNTEISSLELKEQQLSGKIRHKLGSLLPLP